jgi:hypothetical protein
MQIQQATHRVELGGEVELVNAMISAAKARNDHLRGQIELAIAHMNAQTDRMEAETKRDAPQPAAQ